MDFVGKRFWFFIISLLIIAPGIVFLILAPGLRPGIDFTGGSSMTLRFSDESNINQQEVRDQLTTLGYQEATVQNLGENSFFIRKTRKFAGSLNHVVKKVNLVITAHALSAGGCPLKS